LGPVLKSIVVSRPKSSAESPQNLCADKGYFGEPPRLIIVAEGYLPHIRPRGEEQRDIMLIPGYKARRWVVEACHSWLNRFRKIVIRYEKTDASYIALLHLACAIITWRKIGVIYG
jgi:transposase